MKLLLESYQAIIEQCAGNSTKDLARAIHQFTTAVVKKNDFLHDVSMAKRAFCQNGCDHSKNIRFEKMDGSFCSKCGYIYPF